MKISRKTDYALRALLTLAERFGQGPISINQLARLNDIPKRFLEQILLDLKRQGWVRSLPGRQGGYELARPPDQLTVGQIVRHFDNMLAPSRCVSTTDFRPCPRELTCRFRRLFLEIRNTNAALMDRTTLADVLRYTPVTRDQVFDETFLHGAGI